MICVRISAREDGWKRYRSCRSVMRRVFDGGVGFDRGGRLDRSRVSCGLEDDRLALNDGEEGRV